jgi:prepilin-type N-terminal cleavage/methylation domain-containing protein
MFVPRTVNNKRHAAGFTIIEVIVVIVLLGITGAVVVSRFFEPSTLGGVAARDGLIATIRAAQQFALGRSLVTVEIDNTGSDWIVTAKANAATIRTLEISTRNLVLETGSAGASGDTCATGFDTAVAADFELVFDSEGNLEEFTNNGSTEAVNASFNGVRICVNDRVDQSMCVSPAGYAYAGNCDD